MSTGTKKKRKSTLPMVSDHRNQATPPDTEMEPQRPARETTDAAQSFHSQIVLDDKYRLMNEVGRGAMGVVFLAEDMPLERKVAVKFLLPSLATSPDYAKRFNHEAVAMAAIQNHNVAQIFSFGQYGNIPYFVMEFLEGVTVEHLIDAHNRRGSYISVAEAIEILIQSLSGLSAIHRAQAVHRDIKPGNIILTHDPIRVVITDFGLVRRVQIQSDTRALAGTPAYIAPEIASGEPGASESLLTDIYSMGVTAYELLTGVMPFVGETWKEILQMHIEDEAIPPAVRRPAIPAELDRIITKAMQKSPEDRYGSCGEFIKDLIDVQRQRFSEEPRRFSPFRSDIPTIGLPRKDSNEASDDRAFRATDTWGDDQLVIAEADTAFSAAIEKSAKRLLPNCQIHIAADGNQALALVERLQPRLLILNLSLPELSGFEVAAILRGESESNQLAIAMIVEAATSSDTGFLRGMGITDFLERVDGKSLDSALRPILEGAFKSS